MNRLKILHKIELTYLQLSNGDLVPTQPNQKIYTGVERIIFDLGYVDFGYIQFDCSGCRSKQSIDILNAKNKSRLTVGTIDDVQLFTYIDSTIGVSNNSDVYELIYHKCEHCGNQYLIVYQTEGDPGRIHFSTTIHSVWQIEVDEAYFLQFFNKPLY